MPFNSVSKSFRRFIPAVATDVRGNTQEDLTDADRYFTFRTYLGDAPPDECALIIVTSALREIADHEDEQSNAHLYDQLHARLCGPEPLERACLLAFMRLHVQALYDIIVFRAQTELSTNRPASTSAETVPDNVGLARLSLAKKLPREVLCYLNAVWQLAAVSQNRGLIVQLDEFVGCTDLEIAQLLETTPGEVESKRVASKKDIWDAYTALKSTIK